MPDPGKVLLLIIIIFIDKIKSKIKFQILTFFFFLSFWALGLRWIWGFDVLNARMGLLRDRICIHSAWNAGLDFDEWPKREELQ